MIQYPKVNIKSKNELAKRFSRILPFNECLKLINYCKKNKNKLWHDHSGKSEPEKSKFVRAADGKTLKRILNFIDKFILKPNDKFVAPYIYGGFSGRSNIQAAKRLINKKGNRYLLKVDLKSFFEQIDRERVFSLLRYRCGCSTRGANLIADLCCVPKGSKSKPQKTETIARGFPTSSRLATWCSYEFIIELHNLMKKELKKNDFRIAFYVDDIGIVASFTNRTELNEIYSKIEGLAKKHKLTLNSEKKEIIPPNKKQEHLGVRLSKNKISITEKTRAKKQRLKANIKKERDRDVRKKKKESLTGLNNYEAQIKKANKPQ